MSYITYLLFAIAIGKANSQKTWNSPSPINSYNCDTAPSTVVKDVSIGPCFDTWGCTMPACCGIISGTLTNMSLTYIASIPMTAATTHGYLAGLSAGDEMSKVKVPIPLTQIPNLLVSYDYDSCHYTTCPQEPEYSYRFDGLFTIPTTAITTLSVTAHFVGEVKSTDVNTPSVICKKIYVRVVNPDFIETIIAVFENPLLGIILGG